jgi:hypothetical protein
MAVNWKALFAFHMLLACSAVQAADWVQVGESADQNRKMFVDTTSIIITKNIVIDAAIRKASVRAVFAPHSTHPLPDEPYWSSVVAYEAFYCSRKEVRTEGISSIFYEDKDFRPKPRIELFTAWDEVIPDGAKQATISFICAWKPK